MGFAGVILGLAVLLRATLRRRSKVMIVKAAALVPAGLSGTAIVAAAGPGVRAREFSFSPIEHRAKAHTTINVELRNDGAIFHTFTITDLDFEIEANGGQVRSGTLRAQLDEESMSSSPRFRDMPNPACEAESSLPDEAYWCFARGRSTGS